MKVKIKTGSSFSGVVKYVTNPAKSTFGGGTAPSPQAFTERAKMLVKTRPDCKTPVVHISLSQPPGEPLADADWQAAADQLFDGLGLSDHDYIFARHTDTQNDHIHIIISKISPAGKIWNERNSALKAMKICTKIEQNLGLTRTKTLADFRSKTGRRKNIVNDGSTNEFRRTGKVKSSVRVAIQKRKSEEKSREQNRGTHPKTTTYDGRLDALASPNPEKIPATGIKNQRVVGKIASFGNRKGEVNFIQNNQIVAQLSSDRQSINLFKIDDSAIDFAIMHAIKSGKIPLEIFGTDEFILAAEARAHLKKIEIKNPRFSHSPNSASGNNQGLTSEQPLTQPPQKSEPKMKNHDEILLDKLQKDLDATDLNIKVGNILAREKSWRYPLKLKNWLDLEQNTKTRAELLELSQKDARITKEMVKELENDRISDEKAEFEQESTQNNLKMRG
jgi:hypothetical protein